MSYADQSKLKAEQLYIEGSKSPRAIATVMGGRPAAGTIDRWAREGDWKTKRREYQHKKFEQLSPKSMEIKIYEKINSLLDGDIDPGTADQLLKYKTFLTKWSDEKSQIPTMFWMLEELAGFIKTHYPDLHTDRFRELLRDFKDHLLKMLEKPA